MQPRRILVTGGAGYIGSHACCAFAEAGFEPVAYDNLSRGFRDAVRWGPLVEGDILDGGALDRAFAVWKPEAVVHFAAFAYVGESVSEPGMYWRNNVAGSVELLEAMRRNGVDRIVFSSTCATYGAPLSDPIMEDHPQNPVNPYGESKLAVEKVLAGYRRAHGIRSVSLRYFNAAGADPQGRIGENHDPEPHLIPRALMAAAGRLPLLEVYGDDWDTFDGTCVRDYIHVSDLARAHVLAIGKLESGDPPAGMNLGNGRGYSVRQVIESVRRVTGRDVPHRYVPRRQGDPSSLVGSAALAARELGWEQSHPGLDEMVATAWNWMADRS